MSTPLAPDVERRIILLIAAVQFVNIVDFMMVMPLGPDFAVDLGIELPQLGVIGGSYTLAAALSGYLGAFFLDRFDRRPALAISLLGLALGTIAGAFATDLPTLIVARVIAGVFGGPATSIALSIVADVIPPARRGRALSTVMIAFSAASVLGVPLGLELARWGSWHTPFVATGLMGIAAAVGAFVLMPPLRDHLARTRTPVAQSFGKLLTRPASLLSYAATSVAMMGGFVLFPSIAPFVQRNLGYPRAELGLLYGAGGIVSFVTLRAVGRAVDRYGASRVGLVGCFVTACTTWVGFVWADPRVPVVLVFMLFMFGNGVRNVSQSTLSSRVPAPEERASFMSLQSMVQHLASAAGAFVSSRILTESPTGQLVHMDQVAWLSIGLTVGLPLLLFAIEQRVKQDEGALAAAAAS